MSNNYLRLAKLEDIDLLFEWANDEDTRKNAFNSNKINYEEHVKWFNNALTDKNIKIYIYYSNNIPVGQIRLNINLDKAVISYSIERKYRGQGHGKRILTLIESEALFLGIKYLEGKVKLNNIASQVLFEKLDYEKCLQDEYIEFFKIVTNRKKITIDGD